MRLSHLTAGRVAGVLLLKHQRRATNSLPLEIDSYLDAVGDLDEGNSLTHPVIFTVEGHCPFDLTWAVPLPVIVKVSVSGLDTPRIVNVPGISKVAGPVCTTLSEWNVIIGSCLTLKKSLLFNLPSFIPLPVFTLSAWILMSKTPVVTSGDVKVIAASHLSKVPSIATDAFT